MLSRYELWITTSMPWTGSLALLPTKVANSFLLVFISTCHRTDHKWGWVDAADTYIIVTHISVNFIEMLLWLDKIRIWVLAVGCKHTLFSNAHIEDKQRSLAQHLYPISVEKMHRSTSTCAWPTSILKHWKRAIHSSKLLHIRHTHLSKDWSKPEQIKWNVIKLLNIPYN